MMSELDNLFIEFIESLTDRTQSIRCYGKVQRFIGKHERRLTRLHGQDKKKYDEILKVLKKFEETSNFDDLMNSLYNYIDNVSGSDISKKLKEKISI